MEHAVEMVEDHSGPRTGVRIETYYCPFCGMIFSHHSGPRTGVRIETILWVTLMALANKITPVLGPECGLKPKQPSGEGLLSTSLRSSDRSAD